MKHLSSMLVKNGADWLKLAVDSAKDDVEDLADEACRLAYQYQYYPGIVTDFSTMPRYSRFLGIRKLMVEFYESPPTKLRAVLQLRRNNHALQECPSCGYPFAPDTLDHFMPKDDWPEFSIFPNNLTPQCRGCQSQKGSFFYSVKDNQAFFIHPIFSDALSKIGFKVNIEIEGNNPRFEAKFTRLAALESAEEQRLKIHIEKLEIRKRILKFCWAEYSKWKNMISDKKFDIKAALQQRIDEQPYSNSDVARNWQVAFYRGVLKNQQVMDHLNSFAPSAPLPLTEVVSELNF
ncbi:hypothetical protein QFZ83_001344 [Variovorax sp. W1I1]|uniref:hypothetical protein n=1 Tax=Variovorax sp. W1I1 TaxID=3042309 RepID=UPI00278A3076|nr:hypothetical protein [Variovorax sp. W1I1]MDQ0607173.1 hypothetical protein [Variovorax sp. W1I1]